MPELTLPTLPFDINKAAVDINSAVRDGAYIAVGLGVLGFQRAQVQRVELTKQLEAQLTHLNTLQESINSQVESYLNVAREQLKTARTQLTGQLPGQLGDIDGLRNQLTDLVKTLDEFVAPIRQQIQDQIDRLEELLPSSARSVVKSVRAAASSQEQTLRNLVGVN